MYINVVRASCIQFEYSMAANHVYVDAVILIRTLMQLIASENSRSVKSVARDSKNAYECNELIAPFGCTKSKCLKYGDTGMQPN